MNAQRRTRCVRVGTRGARVALPAGARAVVAVDAPRSVRAQGRGRACGPAASARGAAARGAGRDAVGGRGADAGRAGGGVAAGEGARTGVVAGAAAGVVAVVVAGVVAGVVARVVAGAAEPQNTIAIVSVAVVRVAIVGAAAVGIAIVRVAVAAVAGSGVAVAGAAVVVAGDQIRALDVVAVAVRDAGVLTRHATDVAKCSGEHGCSPSSSALLEHEPHGHTVSSMPGSVPQGPYRRTA